MQAYNEAKIRWCSRVPETSAEARAALAHQPEQWQEFSDHSGHYVRLQQSQPQGEERWMMIRTKQNLEEASKSLQKKASKDHATWQKRLKRWVFQCFEGIELLHIEGIELLHIRVGSSWQTRV